MLRTGIILIWLILIFWNVAGAQRRAAERDLTFRGGITAGANFSALQGDIYPGYHKAGVNMGGVVLVPLNDVFTAGMELLYSQKGCRGVRELYSSYVGNMFERYFVNLNYIEVPIQMMVSTARWLQVGGGVSYSRLISSREWIETDQPYHIDNEQHAFRKNDWAFMVGGNMVFKEHWLVTFRYQQSIVPIREPYHVPLRVGSGNQFNLYYTLKLTYLF